MYSPYAAIWRYRAIWTYRAIWALRLNFGWIWTFRTEMKSIEAAIWYAQRTHLVQYSCPISATWPSWKWPKSSNLENFRYMSIFDIRMPFSQEPCIARIWNLWWRLLIYQLTGPPNFSRFGVKKIFSKISDFENFRHLTTICTYEWHFLSNHKSPEAEIWYVDVVCPDTPSRQIRAE